jgi:hypothetical protein
MPSFEPPRLYRRLQPLRGWSYGYSWIHGAERVKFIVTIMISLTLFGCTGAKLKQESLQIRAMTEVDRTGCKYISSAETFGSWILSDFATPDEMLKDGFNDAMNTVASVGGDAYSIVEAGFWKFNTEAWRCDWSKGKTTTIFPQASQLHEISSKERKQCEFIHTVTEAGSWGFTGKRNYEGARRDALEHVQQLGGDSYYVVYVLRDTGSIGFVIEAWRCS